MHKKFSNINDVHIICEIQYMNNAFNVSRVMREWEQLMGEMWQVNNTRTDKLRKHKWHDIKLLHALLTYEWWTSLFCWRLVPSLRISGKKFSIFANAMFIMGRSSIDTWMICELRIMMCGGQYEWWVDSE